MKALFRRVTENGAFRAVCIHTRRKPLQAATFTEYDDFRSYAKSMNEDGYNIYFHPNSVDPRAACHGTAELGEISALNVLHVDIDKGDKKTQRDNVDAFSEKTGMNPTYIVDSGNGLHVYYMLRRSLPASPRQSQLSRT